MINKLKSEDLCLLTFINHASEVIIVFSEYINHRNNLQKLLQVITCAMTLDSMKIVSKLKDKHSKYGILSLRINY